MANSFHRIARYSRALRGCCGPASWARITHQCCSAGACPAKSPQDAYSNPQFSTWGSDPWLHVPHVSDPHGRAAHGSPESALTAGAGSSLNPHQMNDASSNKAQYHNINNIYFQAKLQPGLLIPVIKANGSSVIIFASLEPTVRDLKPCIIFSLLQPPGKGGIRLIQTHFLDPRRGGTWSKPQTEPRSGQPPHSKLFSSEMKSINAQRQIAAPLYT